MWYVSELHPYKYAGYPQLIKTIQLETADDRLFSKSAPLLAAASELAYHTVHCSALNAEELRREKGLDVSGCTNVMSIACDYKLPY
jgi:DnaJ family protein C protein 13